MREIEGLLARVEAATGADRELDARLAVFGGLVLMRHSNQRGYAFFHADEPSPKAAFLGNCLNGEDDAYRSLGGCLSVPRYTSSVDAALALVERVLPGVLWVKYPDNGVDLYRVGRGVYEEIDGSYGRGRTLPLSILVALLRALSTSKSESGT